MKNAAVNSGGRPGLRVERRLGDGCWAIAVAAGILACSESAAWAKPGAVAIDPGLVQSLAEAPEGLIREAPYIAHFKKGPLDLYYLSGDHENRLESPTLSLIRRAFARFKIRRVVVEGRGYDKGEVSRQTAEEIARESRGGVFKWGETDYAILLASRKRVGAVGGEPSGRERLRGALEAGFTARDMLGHGFVIMIPSYRAQGRLGTEPPEALFDETMRWDRREMGIGLKVRFSYRDFLGWYREKTGVDFAAAEVDHMTAKPDSRGSFIQRLSEAVSMVRNRFLAGVITRELNSYGGVLVVYGNGHHAVHRKAVEAAMGPPVYEGDLKRGE